MGDMYNRGGGSLTPTSVTTTIVTADDLEVDSGTLSIDATNNRVGMGTTAPGTQLQIESNTPYVTLKNDTAENTAGGCESKVIFEDHGNNALGQIEVSHVGNSDDEKGQLIIKTNNDSGLQTALTINEAQKVTAAGDVQVTGDIILDDGGSLKEAGGTAAITFDGSGNVTKIGVDSASSGQFLKWNGSKWLAATVSGTVAGSVAADDISAGDAAINLTTTAGNITIDAQGNDTDIIFKGTDGNADTTFLTIDGSAAGAATFNDKIIATELDISGDADIDGTLEADAITVDGTALNEYIADTVGAMVSSNTESGITVAYQDGDNTLDFTVGTLNQDTTGTAAIATTVTCADESSDTTCFVGYVTAATGDLGLKTGSNLTFNSANGTLAATEFSGGGASITGINGSNISSGTVAAARVATLNQDTTGTAAIATTVTVADESSDTSCNVLFTTAATGDLAPKSGTNLTFNSSNGTLACTALSISGDADIDGTLEADAITVNGVTLAETIADTVGAMVSSNTETGITVTYEDSDNTLDFALAQVTSLGTITQDTVTFTSANADDPLLLIKNTTNDAAAARLRFVKDRGTPGQDADGCGEIEFYGDDDNQDNILFAKVRAEVADASNGAEGGRLMMGVATHDGEFQYGLVMEDGDAEDEIDVIIGNGTLSTTTAAGYSKATNGFLVPDGKSVHIETPMLTGSDLTATGITTLMTASEAIAQGDLVYVSGDGTIGKALANNIAKLPAIGLAVAAINQNAAGVILLQGMFRNDAYGFTAGNRLYAHPDATITATAPSGNNQGAQAIGVALEPDVVYFNPSMVVVEITA